jgi:hypothetical protein
MNKSDLKSTKMNKLELNPFLFVSEKTASNQLRCGLHCAAKINKYSNSKEQTPSSLELMMLSDSGNIILINFCP